MSEQSAAVAAPANGAAPANVNAEQNRNWRALEADRKQWQTRAEKAEKRVAELEAQGPIEAIVRDAYQRGRADVQAEIVFAERLSAIRAKYPDFDAAWASVKPLVPRVVWAEVADHPAGLEGAYQLSKLPELCSELSEMPPEKARQRFQFFIRDLMALRGAR